MHSISEQFRFPSQLAAPTCPQPYALPHTYALLLPSSSTATKEIITSSLISALPLPLSLTQYHAAPKYELSPGQKQAWTRRELARATPVTPAHSATLARASCKVLSQACVFSDFFALFML